MEEEKDQTFIISFSTANLNTKPRPCSFEPPEASHCRRFFMLRHTTFKEIMYYI